MSIYFTIGENKGLKFWFEKGNYLRICIWWFKFAILWYDLESVVTEYFSKAEKYDNILERYVGKPIPEEILEVTSSQEF